MRLGDLIREALPGFASGAREMVAVERARVAAETQLEAINRLPAALLRRAFNGEM